MYPNEYHVASHVIVARAYGVPAKGVVKSTSLNNIIAFEDYDESITKMPSIVRVHCLLAGMVGDLFEKGESIPRTWCDMEEINWSDGDVDFYMFKREKSGLRFSIIIPLILDVQKIINDNLSYNIIEI